MMRTLLQEYISIDTSAARNYDRVVDLFRERAYRDGLSASSFVLPSGYPVLIVTLPGSDPSLPALALNHHMDVVPAFEHEGWVANPFSGVCVDDTIVGRGAQDMKGVGVVHYAALCAFKKVVERPRRTIHLLMVPDEERGGFKGVKEFVEHPLFETLRIGYVLDEGLPSGDPNRLLIKIAERTPLQIRITSTGTSSHSSFVRAHNAAHVLVSFLRVLGVYHERELDTLAAKAPGLIVSYHITSLTAGYVGVLNMIPAQAEATLDIRVPPSVACNVVLQQLDDLCREFPTIRYDVLATSAERCGIVSEQNVLYQTLADAINQEGCKSESLYFEATTDARFYAHRGIVSLGFTPFTIKPNLHGVNEAVTCKDLELGKRIFLSFLTSFCH